MGLLVDTSAFVDLERTEVSLDRALGAFADVPVALPAIVLAELLVGVRLAPTHAVEAARRAKVDALRARVPVVEFAASAAERWADLFAFLRSAGHSVPANDLTVAATAVSLGWGVLVGTRDEAHFRRIPGLDVRVLAA